MSKYDYSKAPQELQAKIFDMLIEKKFHLNGLVPELCRKVIPTLSDAEKLKRVCQLFGDAQTMYSGLASRADAEELAVLLGLPDCLPKNNDE